MQLQIQPVHLNDAMLSVSVARKLMVAEHSDLGRVSLLQRLYDDACDVGFALYNPQTNVTTRWAMQEEIVDGEHELQVTIFVPTPETLRLLPQLAGWELHVLND